MVQRGDIVAGRFELERLAGSGAMGAVYRARDRVSESPVALKVLHAPDGPHLPRFLQEAKILAELAHPGIVRYVAHGPLPAGGAFLAMEWLEGETLGERLAREPLTADQSVALAERVARALGAAHRRGIVHRDLKPENLLLVDRRPSEPKLLDFGIARLAHTALALTGTGAMIGTPGYMAPEQARGDRDVGAKADLFSLGCVLFKCLTGRAPFSADDVLGVLLKLVLEPAPRLRSIDDRFPEALDDLCARLMEKSPGERPASADEVAEALAAIGPIGRPSIPTSQRGQALGSAERLAMSLVVAQLGPRVQPAAGRPAHADLARVEAAIDLTGERLHVLADGSLLVMPAAAGAATDQAERAARCALLIRDAHSGARTAVVSGRGVLTGAVPVGEVIERGVELVGAAPPGKILVDDGSAALLGSRFETRRAGVPAPAGRGSVDAFELRSERVTEETRRLLGRATPCVGRERELSTLDTILDDCIAESAPRAVVVKGGAGAGKSRLRYEWLRRVRARRERVEVMIARGDPMRAGAPFGLVSEALRQSAGIVQGDAHDVQWARLEARVARHVPPADRGRVMEFLGELLGVHVEQPSVQLISARADAAARGDQMRRACEDLFSFEAAAHPLLIVLEDLHWGDLPSVKIVDGALRDAVDRPLMVLALARPEVDDVFPKLWAARGCEEMRLRGLSKTAAETLVREVLGDAATPELTARLVERAAGNAFYLEELIRAASQGQLDSLPETILAMVHARLEGLPAEARRVLRVASVFGGTFWRGGVDALVGRGTDVEAWLADLVELELIARRHPGRFPHEEEYGFRNALVQQAAYASLVDEDRTRGHRLAGEWLESAGELEPLVLAEQLERGGERARAVAWYARAAEQALEGDDLALALATVQRAVHCGAEGEALAGLRIIQAEALNWQGAHRLAKDAALQAFAALHPGSDDWFAAAKQVSFAISKLDTIEPLVELAETLLRLGDPGDLGYRHVAAIADVTANLLLNGGRSEVTRRGFEWVERAGSLAALDHPVARAHVCEVTGVQAAVAGNELEAIRQQDAARAYYQTAGYRRNAYVCWNNVAYGQLLLGVWADAEANLRAVLRDAERLGLGMMVNNAKQNLGLALARLGRLGEAEMLTREALSLALEQHDKRNDTGARCYLAFILLEAHELERAEHEARMAVEMAREDLYCASTLAILARVLLARGRPADALSCALEGIAAMESKGCEDFASVLLLVHAEALLELGRAEDARRAIVHARDWLLGHADNLGETPFRESFLRIPENAGILALAERLSSGAAF